MKNTNIKSNKPNKNLQNFKLTMKALVNNEACVEGGRHRPWWIGLILFFVSTIVSLVPVFVNQCKKQGSDFVSTAYSMEVGCERFIEKINEENVEMKVYVTEGGEKYLEVNEADWQNKVGTTKDKHSEQYCWQHYDQYGILDLEVYYVEDITTEIVNNIISNVPGVETSSWEKRSTSCIIFSKFTFYAFNYAGNTQNPVGNCYGDYKNLEPGFTINSIGTVMIDEVEVKAATPTNAKTYYDGVWNNWKNFFVKGYKYNKFQATWKTTLLMFGINCVITIFMGFMIWVLTRGKTNPFRVYTFFETQLIAAWATLAPAILTLIVGFILKQYAQILFPLFIGLRVMWLSMKTLRPEYVAPTNNNKTVKAKTVDAKEKK